MEDFMKANGLTDEELHDFVKKMREREAIENTAFNDESSPTQDPYNPTPRLNMFSRVAISALYPAGNVVYKTKLGLEKLINKVAPSLVTKSDIRHTKNLISQARQAYEDVKAQQGSVESFLSDVAGIAPVAAASEAAIPEIGSSLIARTLPKNIFAGAVSAESVDQPKEVGGAIGGISSLFSPALSRFLNLFAGKKGLDVINIMNSYRKLIPSDYIEDSDVIDILKDVYKKEKENVSDLYQKAIDASTENGEGLELKSLNKAADDEIKDISKRFKNPTNEVNQAIAFLENFKDIDVDSFEDADKIRQIIKDHLKSSNPFLRSASIRLSNAIDDDFLASKSGKEWKEARNAYRNLKQLEKTPLIKNYVINEPPKSDEKVINDILFPTKSITKVLDKISPDDLREISKLSIVRLMGTGSDDNFISLKNFLNRYSKISPEIKTKIFSKDQRDKIADIFNMRRKKPVTFEVADKIEKSPATVESLKDIQLIDDLLSGNISKIISLPIKYIRNVLKNSDKRIIEQLVKDYYDNPSEIEKSLERIKKEIEKRQSVISNVNRLSNRLARGAGVSAISLLNQ